MSHTVAGQTTNYTWDVAASLPGVVQDTSNTYVYGLDLISTTDATGAQTYHLYDGLGSTTSLTDPAGGVVQTYEYQVFGQIYNPSGSNPNYWRFAGEQRDSSNLYYLRSRYYDPDLGRFLTRDLIPHGNRYAYVVNNPVNLVDPYGLFGCGLGPIGNPCQKARDAFECVGNGFDCVSKALCGKEGGFGCVGDAFGEIGEFLARFATLECASALITIGGLALSPATGGASIYASAAISVGINAAASDGPGVVVEAASVSPEAGEQWLKGALRMHGAYGNFTTPGGGQPIVTTVKNLRIAGSSAFLLLSVAECAESAFD
jgi:RHS repeat-associated protein